jgi:hypothetical protein
MRVIRATKEDMNLLVYQSRGFLLVENLPRNWRQAFATYGFVLALIALVIAVLRLPWPWSSHPTLFFIIDLLLLALPFALLSIARNRAQMRAKFSAEAPTETVHMVQNKSRSSALAASMPPPLPTPTLVPPPLPVATGD